MRLQVKVIFFVLIAFGLGVVSATAQTDGEPFAYPDGTRRRSFESIKMEEMLARAQIEREKKDYAEMLQRGEEAVKISNALLTSAESLADLTPDARQKLETLEKLVSKIRDEMGGKDEGGGGEIDAAKQPGSLKEAVSFLKDSTGKLVDEIKKVGRFSISVVAVQSSNNVIRLARALRLRN